MFNKKLKLALQDLQQQQHDTELQLQGINSNLAMIEFTSDGIILDANELFLKVVGYKLQDIVGKHHQIFCEKEYVQTSEYDEFWSLLAAGETQARRFVRITKSGDKVWLEATYFPIMDNGKVLKIIKIASDVTNETQEALEHAAGARGREIQALRG